MLIKNGKVFLRDGKFHDCALSFGETVEGVGEFEGDGLDASGCYVVPGFIDIHTHGAMGRDFSDGDPEALAVTSRYYAENGVTSFLATTMTLKEPQLLPAMACVKNAGALPGARCAGVHLEGPFLSYAKRGAQNPENLHKPDADMFMRLNEASGGVVRLVTVAPEEDGGIEFIRRVSPVCTVSIGHTEADYDTAMRAYEAGASHATHLFNGMPGLHHRKPGVPGAGLADERIIVQAIADGLHLHPDTLRIAALCKGAKGMALISDSMEAAGMPDGQYDLGGQAVFVQNGEARLADGVIAGSTLVLHRAIHNMITLAKMPPETVIPMATSTPADSVGAKGYGRIEPGACGVLTLMDAGWNLAGVTA